MTLWKSVTVNLHNRQGLRVGARWRGFHWRGAGHSQFPFQAQGLVCIIVSTAQAYQSCVATDSHVWFIFCFQLKSFLHVLK